MGPTASGGFGETRFYGASFVARRTGQRIQPTCPPEFQRPKPPRHPKSAHVLPSPSSRPEWEATGEGTAGTLDRQSWRGRLGYPVQPAHSGDRPSPLGASTHTAGAGAPAPGAHDTSAGAFRPSELRAQHGVGSLMVTHGG